ncbi:MAG: hypothetical protein J5927_02920 [Oscillospiraceae bacterium]|nr:hypothetical protein [Oscillospiraceae bacterium]
MPESRLPDAARLSHAYIVSASSLEESLALAGRIAAAAVCTGEGSRPCGLCRACRKAQAGIHPDIQHITRLLNEKGKPKKEIVVEQIRDLALDAVVLPNESSRKVYIIHEADTMNLAAQNAALKLLEEPPAGVIFLLCVTNPGLLLPTVRSRCVEVHGGGTGTGADEKIVQAAGEYLRAVAAGDEIALFLWCLKMEEKLDGREAAVFVDAVTDRLADMAAGQVGSVGLDRADLLRLQELMGRCGAYLRVNISVKQIFGLLAVSSIAGSGNRG